MKRWALAFGALLLYSAVAAAQNETPKIEAFGGYDLVHGSYVGQGYNFNGGGGSVSYNPSGWLGLVGDFQGSHWSGTGLDANLFTYLFGPKIAYRTEKFTPFARVLFGGGHVSGSLLGGCLLARVRPEGITTCTASGSENAFAMTAGGGLDWNATTHIGVRVGQFDYLMTRFNGLGTGGGDTQNSFRFATGVVFRW